MKTAPGSSPVTARARRQAIVKSKANAPHATRQTSREFGALADRCYRPAGAGMKRGIVHFST